MEHIFISYTEKDSQFAHMLADELARWGIKPSIDKRIEKGRQWPPSIQESIKACPVFLVVMSPEAYQSGWVQKEVTFARSIHKPIIPVLLRGGAWGSLPSNQYLDLRNGKMPDRSFSLKVQEAIEKELSRSSPGGRKDSPHAPGRRDFHYQKLVEALATMAKSSGRWKLGEYIIECDIPFFGGATLTVHLADDQVRYSGGQAIPPSTKAKVLGPALPIMINHEQSNSRYLAGYKMTVYSPSKYMDAAIEMLRLYEASDLNPDDLFVAPRRFP